MKKKYKILGKGGEIPKGMSHKKTIERWKKELKWKTFERFLNQQ